jgi:hypothetical protein
MTTHEIRFDQTRDDGRVEWIYHGWTATGREVFKGGTCDTFDEAKRQAAAAQAKNAAAHNRSMRRRVV